MTSRRYFLTQMALAGAAGALTPTLGCAKEKTPQKTARTIAAKKARVVWVTGPTISQEGRIDRPVVRRMLEQGLCALANKPDARAALAQWIRPVDTVGLKINGLAGRAMATHRELVEELIGLLATGGLPRQQALVFDRSEADLRRSGYSTQQRGKDYRCLGNEQVGYEPELTVMPSGASRFSRVATRMASVLVNMPILKDHGLAGLSGALKNNFGLIHNPNKFHLHGCDPYVAEVNAQAVVQQKQRLVICDALRMQVDGGPAFHAAAALTMNTLLLATDAVALDIIAWELLEEQRRLRQLPSLTEDKRRPRHVETAGQRRLGVATRTRIHVQRLKVT